MMEQPVTIRMAGVDEIKSLRHLVLWPHLESTELCEIAPDRLDSTFHLAAFIGDKIVGTSTFIVDINDKFDEKNQYRLRAMATAPEVRGWGVGARIIEVAEKELKNKGIKLLWCDARLIATGFYEKQNFKMKGAVYQVPKIGPHKLMYKEIK
jgi:GNAT superfamily N-acetyltransferase